MRIPLRTIQFIPTFATFAAGDHLDAVEVVKHISEMPAIQKVPVLDTIGLPYAFDIQFTEGFYFVLVAYLSVRTLLRVVVARVTHHQDDHQDDHEDDHQDDHQPSRS